MVYKSQHVASNTAIIPIFHGKAYHNTLRTQPTSGMQIRPLYINRVNTVVGVCHSHATVDSVGRSATEQGKEVK